MVWMAAELYLISIVAKYVFYLSRKVGLEFIRHQSALGSSTVWKG
jgi:hypothetical protein